MSYVIGIDLGTSAVKALLVDRQGNVKREASKSYPLIQERSGYSEQDPEAWVEQTWHALREITSETDPEAIEGISFSGQMHGLVLLDKDRRVLRNAILWNDTRTSQECREMKQRAEEIVRSITKNPILEGFTLPKILWVKRHEPALFQAADVFLLPKDYVRYRLTGQLHMDYSDAAGTLLLDVANKKWSEELCRMFDLPLTLCPPLLESHALAGTVLPDVAEKTGLSPNTKVFAGGADNACGAVGAGILQDGLTLCSIGTSGVILTYQQGESVSQEELCEQFDDDRPDIGGYPGNIHYFNHAKEAAYYAMGVTLSAGRSLSWYKQHFAPDVSYEQLFAEAKQVPPGARGLLFAPYLSGERTPHGDALIRGSFIGVDASHTRAEFTAAVLEGITYSLLQSVEIFREAGRPADTIISIGGGARSDAWLQMQADIFSAKVVKLKSEQGPGMGAAMLAAYGCGWFESLDQCANAFIQHAEVFEPRPAHSEAHLKAYRIYKEIYGQTKVWNERLHELRKEW